VSAELHAENLGVLCLISKIPLPDFFFNVLEVLRELLQGKDATVHIDGFLSGLNRTGLHENLVTVGIQPPLGGRQNLVLQLPKSLPCDWSTSLPEPNSKTFAQWQVAWGIETLLARCPILVGDTLVRLLGCVLLEQKVVLLGDAPLTSAFALVLRGLLWPFRWLHPFLAAPPRALRPDALRRHPLHESPFPMVFSLTELPEGVGTYKDLPSEVVVGVLNHDIVHASEQLTTEGGLTLANVTLPAVRVLRRELMLAKRNLDHHCAVARIQARLSEEVANFAELVRAYAQWHLAEAKAKQVQLDICEVVPDEECFIRWLQSHRRGVLVTQTEPFYRTFFLTQMCVYFLTQELEDGR